MKTVRTTRRTQLAPMMRLGFRFQNSTGSLRGHATPDGVTHWPSGRLNTREEARFRADADAIRYLVWSYGTPIAWSTGPGEWYEVEQKFSRTTSCHQSQVRHGVNLCRERTD
jgi:hypothetical protein